MTTSPPEDDDRTVIRPPGASAPGSAAAAAHRGANGTTSISGTNNTNGTNNPDGPHGHHGHHAGGLPVGTRLGEFEITAFVAEGGFGLVYTAHDHSLQRTVALKEYMPSSLASRGTGTQVQVKSERHRDTFEAGLKSFINEARLLASFDHPSLVKVYRFWEANGTAYLVMPYLQGATLKDVLRQMGQPPSEAWLRSLLGPLTEALMVIHAQQCYHRDIAPDNVMLLQAGDASFGLGDGAGAADHGGQGPGGRWLLLDFGAARRVIGDMTQALTVILKPGYAPVEQYAEIPGMKQGAWTDVYALAAVVYFAIMGKTPPPSVGRLLNDTYVPLVQSAAGRCSENFLAAIDRALAVRPESRTQSVGELRRELGLAGLGADRLAVAQSIAAPPAAAEPSTHPDANAAQAPAAGGAGAPFTSPAGGLADGAAAGRAGGRRSVLAAAGVVAAGVLGLGVVAFGAYRALAPISTPPAASAAAAGSAPVTIAPAVSASSSAAPSMVAPSAAATAAGAATFDPAAEFGRIVQAQTPGFAVQAAADKPAMRAGRDELKFKLSSEREGFVYVFGHSSDGTLALLVPNARSGTVRVKPGQTWRFPTGDGFYLPADEPLGTSQVLVMVSARQRNFDALRPRSENLVRYFPTGAAAQALAAQHRAAGSVLAGQPLCSAGVACGDEYGAAMFTVDTVK